MFCKAPESKQRLSSISARSPALGRRCGAGRPRRLAPPTMLVRPPSTLRSFAKNMTRSLRTNGRKAKMDVHPHRLPGDQEVKGDEQGGYSGQRISENGVRRVNNG